MKRRRCVNCSEYCQGWLCADCWRVALIAGIAGTVITSVLNAVGWTLDWWRR